MHQLKRRPSIHHTNTGAQSSTIDEVELRSYQAEHLNPSNNGYDSEGHCLSACTVQYNCRSQNGKEDTGQTSMRDPIPLWKRYTVSTVPLRRGHSYLSDRMRRSRFQGWRMGVLFGCFTSFTVLCINVALLALGAINNGGYKGGVAGLIYGDGRTVSRWNTGMHVFINILGTCLLLEATILCKSPAHQQGKRLTECTVKDSGPRLDCSVRGIGRRLRKNGHCSRWYWDCRLHPCVCSTMP
ncbi:uncharacterized protein M421DRAFT_426532 [Didymella exigua CBS 183.55]|uniref:DUF6536 domain-containing protein n=1 Tax=Didymella exigua CBS 183.55 TaxID=1150837 RepID=A0A6A5R533_9PLEO|nr:uncharacterized protein M421DRAFT_426532 [Didymella exigua CBS 183.55]KAF1922792.1 hypothetical protein M421DRAFT_426532 [Didymella exigua CBS 183.55]